MCGYLSPELTTKNTEATEIQTEAQILFSVLSVPSVVKLMAIPEVP